METTVEYNKNTKPTATKGSTIKDWLTSDQLKSQVTQALPKHCTPDRFMRVMFTSMQRVPKLMKCTQDSLFSAFITCSQLGIEPDGRRAHLIPYENRKAGKVECQLIIDYKGIAELVLRSGNVSYLHADVICENDVFIYNKGELERHEIDFKKTRGKVYAAYALVKFRDGTEKCEVMSLEEIEGIRSRSRAGKSGPWVTDYNEMCKKTVFRRLSKWLPLSPEQKDVIEADDNHIDLKQVADPIPVDALNLGDSMRQIAGPDESEKAIDVTK